MRLFLIFVWTYKWHLNITNHYFRQASYCYTFKIVTICLSGIKFNISGFQIVCWDFVSKQLVCCVNILCAIILKSILQKYFSQKQAKKKTKHKQKKNTPKIYQSQGKSFYLHKICTWMVGVTRGDTSKGLEEDSNICVEDQQRGKQISLQTV